MGLLKVVVWLVGLICFVCCIGMIILVKKKRSDDWKLIVGTGAVGIIWMLYVLNQIFG